MKKFYYSLVLAFVATMLAVGCTQDLTTDEDVLLTDNVVKEMMNVTASLECDDAESGDDATRTTLIDNNGGKIEWSEDDAIGAISADGTITKCVASDINGSSAMFSVPTDIVYAFYPYNSSSTFSKDTGLLTHSLVSSVTLDGSNRVFNNNENVMCAHLVSGNLTFKNLCGFIEIKLKGSQTVKHIALRNDSNVYDALSGQGTIDMSDAAEPKFTPGTNHGTTFNHLYATCSVALKGSEATSFYFIVPPRTYNNLAICVQTERGSYSIATKNAITVNRSKIRPLQVIDIDALAPTATTDLSADGVANCYVVPQGSAAKWYSFPARKINAAENLSNAAYAHLSWSEGAQLVNNVSYDASTGTISFKYEGNNAEGNAQIVLLDANHKVLWAWHIWCTDQPKTIVVRSNSTNYAILDRNLGATYTPKTSAEAASISESDATDAGGLYYQYGRPTPYPRTSSVKYSSTESTAFKTTTRIAVQYGFAKYNQHFTFSNSANSYDSALSFPKCFYAVYYSSAAATATDTSGSYYTWYKDAYSSYTDKEMLWYSIDNDVVDKKATNDPCPAGYVVDDAASANAYLHGFAYTKSSWGSANTNVYGYYYECPVTGSVVYIPTVGFRSGTSGKVSYCSKNFNLWAVPTATDNTNKLHAVRISSDNNGTSPQTPALSEKYTQIGQGFSLRCRLQDRSQLQSVTVVASTFEGEGTAASPFLIKTAGDLVKLAGLCDGSVIASDNKDYTAAHYVLSGNIDMSGTSFTPIAEFKGSFDGKNYTISGLTVTPKETDPTGLFGEITNATVKNLNLTNLIILVSDDNQLYTGGIAGKAVESTIENCSVAGTVSSAATASHTGISESRNVSSVVGGLVGFAHNTNFSNVTYSGSLTATKGQYCGGLVAVLEGGSVANGHLAKGSLIYNAMNHTGGIVGYMGLDATISNCTVEAPVTSKYAYLGGIAGRMHSGHISDCLVSSDARIEGNIGNGTEVTYYGTGGIVGIIESKADSGTKVVVEKSACYTNVSANIYVGGIVGVIITNSTTISPEVSNCLFVGGITASYKNSYNYGLSGGLIGCSHQSGTKGGNAKVTDCVSLLSSITFNSVASNAGYGGLSGYIKNTEFLRCYSNLDLASIVSTEGKSIAEYTSMKFYGSLYGRGNGLSHNNTLNYCYYLPGKIGQESVTQSNVETLTITQMTDGTHLAKLNAAGGNWKANASGYPVPTAAPANTATVLPENKTRVSIIGDSISTFEGWMPEGYVKFYPMSSNATVVSAAQTYWYKLIYKYMKNARLDMNIAWSGTVVARSTDPDYLATDHGAGHCFVERFIADGMGNPDVILLHGGTNDVSNRGKSISLYPGYPIYKASDYNASACPTDAEMKVVFDEADAATTRAQIEAIDDTTFVYAYVKLLSLMHQQYPSAKVVMIIGDWIPAGTRQAILKIAAHHEARYGYKCVDLQEISPYGTSNVIPKEAGCHPNEEGFEVMANYIYQKVGSYID